jgi:hypothetical protein
VNQEERMRIEVEVFFKPEMKITSFAETTLKIS